jgi:mRNA interferase RelE/StbE
MRTAFRSSFARDLKKIEDQLILNQVRQVIEDVETAENLRAIDSLKKMSGGGKYFRIRVSDYRIGIVVDGDEIEFVRCLHRRDIYRFFP